MRIILILVAAVVPLLVGMLLVARANLARQDRYRQLAYPLVALVFGLVTALLFADLHRSVQGLLRVAAERVPVLAGLHTEFGAACTLNFLLLAAFSLVKVFLGVVMRAIAKPYDRFGHVLFGRLYAFDATLGLWCLRDKLVGARLLLKALYLATAVVAALLFVGAGLWPGSPAFANAFYPAYAVLVVGEAFFFLDGVTARERRTSLDYEEDQARRVFRYGKAQEALRHYFGDRLLRDLSWAPRRSAPSGHRDFCEELKQDERPEAQVAGAYFSALLEAGLIGQEGACGGDELSHDDALNTVKLLEGRSVMYASPFYRDYLPYVSLPLCAELMRNRRAVVLYGASNVEEDVAAFVRDGLSFVTNVERLWRIGPLDVRGEQDPDVALLPFSALGDTGLILANAAYLREVSFVVVIDPSSMLATYQVGLSILAERLSEGHPVTYCIFDQNSDGLLDSLSHALRTSLTEVSATERARGGAVGMLWDVDGDFLQHRLFSDVARYLGVGSELGLVALKQQVSRVSWASGGAVPLTDLRWILGQYYAEVFDFAERPQEQGQVDRCFEFCVDPWSMAKQPQRFVIVEDEGCNLFEACRQYATRGSVDAFVNVLSPSYLLRDYMVENSALLSKDPKAFPAFAPDFARSQRNAIYAIVMMMVQGRCDLSEEEVERRLRYAGALDDKRSIKEALEGMIVEHFAVGEGRDANPEDHVMVTESAEYVPALREIVTQRRYGLDDAAAYAHCFRSLRNVPLVTEQPDGSELLLGSRLYGHVHQTLLPGQYLTIKGKYYEAVSISDEAGVSLRRAADHFSHRRYYRQLRRYVIDGWADGERPGDTRTVADLRVSLGSASVAVETVGYLDMVDYHDFASARRVELAGVPLRRYRNKGVLRLDLEGASRATVVTIAVVMSELLRTLYPKDHAYLAVLVPGSILQEAESVPLPEGLLYASWCPEEEGCLYLVEDSLIDIGLLSSIDRNILRILEMCADYLGWHDEMLEGREAPRSLYELGEVPAVPVEASRTSWWRRLLDRLRGRSKEGQGEEAPIGTDEAAVDDEGEPASDEAAPEDVTTEGEPPAAIGEPQEDGDAEGKGEDGLEDDEER